MRRSICLSEPQRVLAGKRGTWKFHYTTASPLPEGTLLKFDLLTRGREMDWEAPYANLSEPDNVIYAIQNEKEIIEAVEIEVPDTIIPQYEFTLPAAMKAGETLTIVVGAPPKPKKGAKDLGNTAQLPVERRRQFFLYIDPKGKGNYEEPEIFTVDIRGNKLETIRILTPSFVAKNKRFDITVRFEDEYGNLTHNAPEDTLIDLSYEHLRENLNWKLFIPETGFVILPNLYFNEAGVYRIQLKMMNTGQVFTSAPIKCFNETDQSLFWGQLHGESERYDSTENIESALRHFRDERHWNFFATSPFEMGEETTPEIWKLISQNVQDFNEEERFITLLGFQYVGDSPSEGIRQFLLSKDSKPILRRKEAKNSSLPKLYKGIAPKDALTIPTFTMGGKKYGFDFKDFDPQFEKVVEIYNAWGSSECTEKEGNPFPIKGFIKENPAGSVVGALKEGHRFGFVAGGLDDRGIYNELFDSEQVQYSPGLTAIMTTKQNREGVLDALSNRRCYATTGARIICGFYIVGSPMGSVLSCNQKPGLSVNRHITGYVAGTDVIKTIEILRNGEVIETFHPKSYHFDYFFDDMKPLSEVSIQKGAVPFVFYYLRVTQEDGHVAWSSPIWVEEKSE